jgi:hypothetical protein
MDPAVAAVLGAGLGASATVLGSVVNARFQAKRDTSSWQRERKQTAYYSATRALLRIRNRRRRMAESFWSQVPRGELPTFLDDLVDAQHGLSMLLVACGEAQRLKVRDAVEQFDRLVDAMLANPPPAGQRLVEISTGVDDVWNIVLAAERADLGG